MKKIPFGKYLLIIEPGEESFMKKIVFFFILFCVYRFFYVYYENKSKELFPCDYLTTTNGNMIINRNKYFPFIIYILRDNESPIKHRYELSIDMFKEKKIFCIYEKKIYLEKNTIYFFKKKMLYKYKNIPTSKLLLYSENCVINILNEITPSEQINIEK